jgi:hypothetical protein
MNYECKIRNYRIKNIIKNIIEKIKGNKKWADWENQQTDYPV